ncbi:uncharacterized protein LOC109196914 isoform X2 [Oreochromis niloticus]|uniref:uncharacterized protein LOC109196914 isoform X2 n=1 Tax=Oreochromis niloticus TaxID=8128 RepID=UPI000DF186D8|nr:uncharacterized protein LOC109196914 isoform X2 [Oreochromis niloticus]
MKETSLLFLTPVLCCTTNQERTDNIIYGEIVTKDKQHKSAKREFPREPDVIYSEVKHFTSPATEIQLQVSHSPQST